MSNFLSEESPSVNITDSSKNIPISSKNSASLHDNELEHLRQMLFARELVLLEEIVQNQKENQLDPEKISQILAESIILRTQKDRQLNIALEPVVDDILKESLDRHKNNFVTLLFPLIGPVIRKSISEAFISMLSNISRSMEIAFSWRGLQWRFESWRSGVPFNKIVLLHSVVYRVEQIFFIHSETGLLLSHIVNEEIPTQDADMVSAMLTAIQDFVQDSFSQDKDSNLSSLQMAELSVIIERNDIAYVACIVRGTPPSNFRTSLQDAFDMMLIEYAKPLADFSGDSSPFLTASRYLQPLLLSRTEEIKKIPFWAKMVSVTCLLTILFGGSYLWYKQFTKNTLLQDAVLSLEGYPGIIITNIIKHKNAPWEVLAFKDALAPHPEEILQENGFSPTLVNFKTVPFISYNSSIILRRVKNALSPPNTVTMELNKDGTLILSGRVSIDWMIHARDTAKSLPGIKQVDISRLHDPLIDQVLVLIEEINKTHIRFPLGEATPIDEELVKLEKTVENLVQLEEIAQKNNLSVALTIYGHADATGSEKSNYEISQARAKTVAARLYAKGSNILISIYGLGSEFSKNNSKENLKTEDQDSRRIELYVTLSRTVSTDNLFRNR